MHQSVDNGDDTGRVREHLAPFRKRAVGGHDVRLEFIAAVDDVKQEIGVAISVGEVPDFVQRIAPTNAPTRWAWQETRNCVSLIYLIPANRALKGLSSILGGQIVIVLLAL